MPPREPIDSKPTGARSRQGQDRHRRRQARSNLQATAHRRLPPPKRLCDPGRSPERERLDCAHADRERCVGGAPRRRLGRDLDDGLSEAAAVEHSHECTNGFVESVGNILPLADGAISQSVDDLCFEFPTEFRKMSYDETADGENSSIEPDAWSLAICPGPEESGDRIARRGRRRVSARID